MEVDPNATGQASTEPAAGGEAVTGEGAGPQPAPGEAGAEKPADGEPAKAEDAPVVPEKYADFVLPKGYGINETMQSEFTGLAKELKLSQESAQKLVDLGGKLAEGQARAHMEAFGKLREGWQNEIKADAEYGGDKLPVTLERANRALRTFGSPELIKLLGESGYGDNPDLIRMFAKIDAATGEKLSAGGDAGTKKEKTDAELLYG